MSFKLHKMCRKQTIPSSFFASVSKRVPVKNHSYENEFDLHIHFHVNETRLYLNGTTRFETEAKDNSEMTNN